MVHEEAATVESSDSESEEEEEIEKKPALWVERYAPRKYTELLSDEVSTENY